jgi:hypothetical protein
MLRRSRFAFLIAVMASVLLGGISIDRLTSLRSPHVHQAHAADPNQHEAMHAGGYPPAGDELVATEALGEYCDPATGECIKEAGLGSGAPNRSYVTERTVDGTIYRSVDVLTCAPQHKDVKEVGVFLILDWHVQGPKSTAPGAPTSGCVRWHPQADPNFLGRQVNQVGRDGTGKRAPVALKHGFVMEVPNPDWGKPDCVGGLQPPVCSPYRGKWLHTEIIGLNTFEIALTGGQDTCVDVWYIKQFTPGEVGLADHHVNRHGYGQNRIPIVCSWLTLANGKVVPYMTMSADGNVLWDTCARDPRTPRWPGDEALGCWKFIVDVARGSARGQTPFNPNQGAPPHDRFGNRLVPLSYHWVRCLDDQAAIVMPQVQDADGAFLNPHAWTVNPIPRILPYQPPQCAYAPDVFQEPVDPAVGFVGVPNGPPAPEPTGEVPPTRVDETPEPTPVPTDTPTLAPATETPISTSTPEPEATVTPTETPVPTATQAPAAWRVLMGYDSVDYFAGSDALERDQRPAPIWQEAGLQAVLDHNFEDGPPAPGLPADEVVSVYYGMWQGPIHAIRVRADDSVRVFINDGIEVDCQASCYSTVEYPITHVDNGIVPVRVEHVEHGGKARVRVEFVSPTGRVVYPGPPEPTAEPATEPPTVTPEPTPTETIIR